MAGLTRANYGRTGLSGPVRDRPERLLLYPPIIAVETWEEDRLQQTLRQIGSRLKLHVYDWTVGNPLRRIVNSD